MIDIISIAGCPALTSSANAILGYAQTRFAEAGLQVETVNVLMNLMARPTLSPLQNCS